MDMFLDDDKITDNALNYERGKRMVGPLAPGYKFLTGVGSVAVNYMPAMHGLFFFSFCLLQFISWNNMGHLDLR